jgi:hypothetical protein
MNNIFYLKYTICQWHTQKEYVGYRSVQIVNKLLINLLYVVYNSF